MFRLLFVALLIAPAVIAAPVPKEDDTVLMRRLYGVPFDPEKDSRFVPSRGTLRIAVPEQPRLLGPWVAVFNAPRVWRDVSGEFSVSVRVTFPIRPKLPAKNADAPAARASGGLVAWVDNDNFVTVTRDERECDGEPGEFVRAEAMIQGKARGAAHYRDPKEFVYLRMQRKDKETVASFSADGEKWKHLTTFPTEWADTMKVGVVAENSFKTSFDATFDQFNLTLPMK